jgi:hypothetical protein
MLPAPRSRRNEWPWWGHYLSIRRLAFDFKIRRDSCNQASSEPNETLAWKLGVYAACANALYSSSDCAGSSTQSV